MQLFWTYPRISFCGIAKPSEEKSWGWTYEEAVGDKTGTLLLMRTSECGRDDFLCRNATISDSACYEVSLLKSE